MTKKTLHNKLNKQTKEELLGLIIEMQEKFSQVDDYLQSKFSKNTPLVVEKYKKQITKAIYIDGYPRKVGQLSDTFKSV